MAWKHLFSKSANDYGTLAFFRNKLNRVAVTKEPKKSVDATIEFLDTVIKGHWLGCACEILGIASLDDPFTLPPHIRKGKPKEQVLYVQGIARKIVERLTLVDSAFLECPDDSMIASTVHWSLSFGMLGRKVMVTGSYVAGRFSCCTSKHQGVQSMHWRH